MVPWATTRAHDVPHLVAAARVEAGGRLVEEEQVGRVEDAGGDVEAPPHAARVVLDLLAGRVGQPEGVEQLRGPLAARPLRWPSSRPSSTRFSRAGEVLVDRGVLAGEAHPAAHRVGLAHHVVAEDAGLAAVGPQQGGEHPHGGGLAGAVRAEDAVDRAGGHGEVDAVDGPGLAERLHQARGLDREAGRSTLLPWLHGGLMLGSFRVLRGDA